MSTPSSRASRSRHATALLCALLALGGAVTAADDEALANLARGLVEKRSAVEKLAAQLELDKTQLRDDVRGLALQRADLQRQLQAAELETAELDRACAERREKIAAARSRRDAISPVVRARLADLIRYVEEGLPFKQQGRLAELRRLRDELEGERLDGQEALGRFWSSCEDELRLTRENGLYRQQITLEGASVLADVAKLGMVLLYFRALDGRLGVVVPAEQGGWVCRLARDERERRQIAQLFDALDKHVRRGFFELPNPYAGASVAPVQSRQGGAR